jgi:hypothetical protein
MMRLAAPQWAWQDPLAGAIAPPPKGTVPPKGLLNAAISALGLGAVNYTIRSQSDDMSRLRPSNRELLRRLAACTGLAGLIAATLLMLLLKSDDRGQVIFAILASFTLAVMIAHLVMPAPYPLLAWLPPLVLAIVFYMLASLNITTGMSAKDWSKVPMYARSLPIDWMTFGIGGGLLGYWFSCRIHEGKHIEDQEAMAAE